MGGRGAAIQFNSQNGSGADDSVQDFPARFNMKHDHSYSATENEFIKLYRTSDIEHAISVDDNGYTYAYAHGGETALKDKKLEFTINGKTWKRNSLRSKSFYNE